MLFKMSPKGNLIRELLSKDNIVPRMFKHCTQSGHTVSRQLSVPFTEFGLLTNEHILVKYKIIK